jgi:hypothetical protein
VLNRPQNCAAVAGDLALEIKIAMPQFTHHGLSLLNPSFDSPLVDVLTELEHLRRLQLAGTTPPQVFFQLKHIFHMLESLVPCNI